MAIKKGYKQTDTGIIPEDWEVKRLKEILASYQLGGNYPNSDELSEFPLMKMGNINRSYIDLSKIQYIKPNIRPKNEDLLCYGDVLFNTRNTLELVGKVAIWRDELPIAYFNSNLMRFKFDKKYISSTFFINLILNTKQSLQQLKGIAIGTTSVAAIYTRDLLYIQIPIPTLAEQTAIATALSDIDALITALDKKILKKKLIKQGAMQQLLTGKKRLQGFSGEWVEKRFSYGLKFQVGYPFMSEYFNKEHGIRLIKNRDLKAEDQIVYYRGQYSEDFIVESGDVLIGMDGDFIPCLWNKGHALLNQRVGRLLICKDWDINFFYYYLQVPLKEKQEMTGATTVKHLSHNDVENLCLPIPPTKSEQTSIAQILSDMDNEIAALETKRDKYKLVKSGMMQQLLTGQIRLVQKLSENRVIPVAAHVVGGHIVNKLYDSKGWGRTKLQKSIHLVGYYCQLDFGNEYIRNIAGPDDQLLMDYIDSKFKQYRHVRIEIKKDSRGGKHYNYIPTPMITEVEQAFDNYPIETQESINNLLNKIKKMDLSRTEIVSTLYAVWNNRIIKRQPINDDFLLRDFYDWSAHKSDFSRDLVLRGLNYMRQEGIIPIGWGKYIDKSKV